MYSHLAIAQAEPGIEQPSFGIYDRKPVEKGQKSLESHCFEQGSCSVKVSPNAGWVTGLLVGNVSRTRWVEGRICNGGELAIESPGSEGLKSSHPLSMHYLFMNTTKGGGRT